MKMENSGKSFFFIVCDILRFFVDIIFYEKNLAEGEKIFVTGRGKYIRTIFFFLFVLGYISREKKRDSECKKYSWVEKK